jgi:glucose-6-phosphate isomerase
MSDYLKNQLLSPVRFDDSLNGIEVNWSAYEPMIAMIHENLEKEFFQSTGWIKNPFQKNESLIPEIQQLAMEIKKNADVLVVLGIGGSYLGAKAIQSALTHSIEMLQDGIEVIYAGHNLSGAYIKKILKSIAHKNIYLHVISKSGNTLETALAFRVFRQWMQQTYGEKYYERIIITTDEKRTNLTAIAEKNNYRYLTIPTTIGGRYSIFTAVGLLPLAVAGVDIQSMLKGAGDASVHLNEQSVYHNYAYRYAVNRNELLRQGYQIELLASFEPCLTNFHEWWKQLFAESEGKECKGLFPTSASYSTDLHSLGQFVQEGNPILFETILHFQQIDEDYCIPINNEDEDGLNYLAHKGFNEVNTRTKDGVIAAHKEGNIPVLQLQLEKLDAYHIGFLCYFFMKACAISACLLNVNPFNQPGVEQYKIKTAELLGNNSFYKIY